MVRPSLALVAVWIGSSPLAAKNNKIKISAMNAKASLAPRAFWYANWFGPTQAGKET